MNVALGRIFCRFTQRKPSNISKYNNNDQISIPHIFNNGPTRYKMRMTNPGVYLFRKQTPQDNWTKYGKTIGVQGYCLLGIPILTFGLGTWQVYRRQWKLDLIEDLKKRSKTIPVPLPENLTELEAMEYQPVCVKGTFLHDKEFIMGPKTFIRNGEAVTEHRPGLITVGGARGYWIITPFKLADRDLTILVNRGWVPREYKAPEKRKILQSQDETEIVGLVRLTENQPSYGLQNDPAKNFWASRDLDAMSEHYGTAPIFIDRVVDKDLSQYPIGGQTRLLMKNDHLSYLITWYSLSAITALMWFHHFISKRPVH